MSEFPIIKNKRFWKFRLNELVDKWSHQVNKASEELPDEPKPIADFVIENHTYPLYHGKPDDSHKLNCFHGDWCKTVKRDFWQYPQETLVISVGDCEDVSILATSLIGKILNANQVYEVFGVVKDRYSDRILGGHGWNYTRWGGKWHYVETTRDTPPEEYPVVKDIREPYVHGDWKLVPYVLFNWKRYEELKGGLTAYMDLDFSQKETREKYEALAEINEARMKPLVEKEKEGIVDKIVGLFRRW